VIALYAVVAALGYNLLVALVYGYDKWQAKRGGWRVSERMLISMAALFGALGAFTTMRLFRHKTRKPKFSVGVPLLLLLQLVAAGALVYDGFIAASSMLFAR